MLTRRVYSCLGFLCTERFHIAQLADKPFADSSSAGYYRCTPHLREYFLRSMAHENGSGLPPQVRGTRNPTADLLVNRRFIPAGAGNTNVSGHASVLEAVHPRRCGEHRRAFPRRYCRCGSSPQVRGTLDNQGIAGGERRFIPAGAGNTTEQASRRSGTAVHPRRCGEHWIFIASCRWSSGSSPQVRGTLDSKPGNTGPARFIPAGAGNTHRAAASGGTVTVHPRRCGEHTQPDNLCMITGGSSPQVRGTRDLAYLDDLQSRFIPAGAGNTKKGGALDKLVFGSSPQVRGTPSAVACPARAHRFIPAGAGNTSRRPL